MNPEIIVQKQLEAYNARDLEPFLVCFAPDIELYNFQEPQPFAVGRAKLREIYKEVFANSPQLHAKIANRTIFDNKVIDHELVTGRKGIDLVEILAIYEVENELIQRVTFMRKA